VLFLLTRKYGRPLVYRFASPAVIERWDRIAGVRGPLFYFFMFVLPLFPSDLMCYVAGLGKISGRQFFAANFTGRLLSTVAMTLIGSYGFRPPLGFWILFVGSIAVLATAWGIYDHSLPRILTKRRLSRSLRLALPTWYRNAFGISREIGGSDDLPGGTNIPPADQPVSSDSADQADAQAAAKGNIGGGGGTT